MKTTIDIVYLVSVLFFIVGLKRLSSPRTARQGNLLSMLGMGLAISVTFLTENMNYTLILLAISLSAIIGITLAKKVPMTSMPEMVALLNGFGGAASALVATAEFFSLVGSAQLNQDIVRYVTLLLSVIIGSVTLAGSLIAFAKLQGILGGQPMLVGGSKVLNILFILILVSCGVMIFEEPQIQLFIVILGVAILFGITLVIPIGGADMPVVVSLLNSYSGIAVAMTGFVLMNNALIIVGSAVGASGIILTQIMCKAMNRSLLNVLFGGFGTGDSGDAADQGAQTQGSYKSVSAEEAGMILDVAERVIIVPGYGMAVSEAQYVVKKLTDMLEKSGAKISYAIHPVAGRMPGHMNVLLAEAGVDYEKLYDLDQINDEFSNTDVSIVIGANDVVNPAAKTNKSSPIYGMPVLNVDHSKTVLVLKRSMNPGYAGIDNDLFYKENTLMVFGDAKKTVEGFLQSLEELNS